MRFNKLDLNLLVALDALLHEQSISRAAVKLHVTQPAMSNALARLRDYFDDDLMVQVGRRMELTPHAEVLKEAVHDLLLRLNSTIAARPEFEPSKSERTFRIFISDFTMASLLPRFLARVHAERATVRFSLLPQVQHPETALSRGEADLVILPRVYLTPENPIETLFTESFSCVLWEESPLARGEFTVDKYAGAGHVVMRPPGVAQASMEAWFVEMLQIERRVALETYSFALAPNLVVGTDLVATVHSRIAEQAARSLPVVIRKPPFAMPDMEQAMQWHRYKTKDPGIAWLRRLMLESTQDLPRAA